MTSFEKLVRYLKDHHRSGDVVKRQEIVIDGEPLKSVDEYLVDLRKAGFIHELQGGQFSLDPSFAEASLDSVLQRCWVTRTVIERIVCSLRRYYCVGQIIPRSSRMVLPDLEDVPSDTVYGRFGLLRHAGLVTVVKPGKVALTADLMQLPIEDVLARCKEGVSQMKRKDSGEPVDMRHGEDVVRLPATLDLLDRAAVVTAETRAILDRYEAWTILHCLEKRMESEAGPLREARSILRKTTKNVAKVKEICNSHTKDAILDYLADRVTSRP